MQRFVSFCTGCHTLRKETGSQTGVPRPWRLCMFAGAICGNGYHLVCDCHGLKDLHVPVALARNWRRSQCKNYTCPSLQG